MLQSRSPMTVGLILCVSALAVVVAPTPVLGAATFVVNKTGDAADNNIGNGKCDSSAASGKQCTLRAAIQEANATLGADTINFNITSASKVIAPSTPLPSITDKVTIDGYSQSGAAENTLAIGNNAVLKVVLDGVNAPASAHGLDFTSPGSMVKGLVIQHFQFGVSVVGTVTDPHAEPVVVRGNFIGTDAAGTQARANGTGVRIDRSRTLVGGDDVAARNVISANDVDGIFISEGTIFVTVKGNYIGTNAQGTAGLGNAINGVSAQGSGLRLGGSAVAQRNVISANGHAGVALAVGGVNLIIGNYIGTKADGTGDLGNDIGIAIADDQDSIGGANAGNGNLISGNDTSGIKFSPGANFHNVVGNVIKQNGDDGLFFDGGNTVTVDSNQIFSNGRDGIRVGSLAGGIKITGNQIFSNGALGINLVGGTEDAFGTTSNDTDDPDFGANLLQNYPVLTLAQRDFSDGTGIVRGTLNSTASKQFRVDIYGALVDASGHGEGQVLLASGTVTTDSGGDKSFSFTINSLTVGQIVTATATATGCTSEFSANRTVTLVP